MISLNTYLYLKLFDIIHLLQNACAYLFLHIIVGAVFAGINLNQPFILSNWKKIHIHSVPVASEEAMDDPPFGDRWCMEEFH